MGLFGRDEKDPKEPAKDPLKDFRPAENKSQSFDPKTVTTGQAHAAPPQAPAGTAAKESTVSDKDRVEGGDGDVQAYLGKGSRVSGKLNFEGTVRVDGQVEGEIAAQDTLIVGERAVVTAQISGTTIIIRGKVTGDINARKRVEIRAPGRLFGNIVTPSLVIHEGVIFEGHCSMASGAEVRSAEAPKASPLSKDEKGGNGVLARISSEATK
jgi:cytoskeletal protein CcmA (bactofilin family)